MRRQSWSGRTPLWRRISSLSAVTICGSISPSSPATSSVEQGWALRLRTAARPARKPRRRGTPEPESPFASSACVASGVGETMTIGLFVACHAAAITLTGRWYFSTSWAGREACKMLDRKDDVDVRIVGDSGQRCKFAIRLLMADRGPDIERIAPGRAG